MKWLGSIFVGLVAAPLTAIITGTAADFWSRWLSISSRDGAAGYWVVLIALLAGVAGLVVGISVARGWLLSTPNFWSALGTTLGLMAAATLVIHGILWLATDHSPKVDGRGIEVVAELRYPPGTALESLTAPTTGSIVRQPGGDSSGSAYFDIDKAREVDGHVVASAVVPVYTSASKKFLGVAIHDGPRLFYPLAFGSKPAPKDFEWSDWLSPVAPGSAHTLRYRVQVEPPPPPRLTREEEAAQIEAKQMAEFQALAPDAPIADYLAHIKYGASQTRIDAAVAAIRARPGFVAEMTREIEGEREASENALRAMEHMKPPPAELAGAVGKAGDKIAGLLFELEKVPADSAEIDPRVAEISTRFVAWMCAVLALQEAKLADFTPQLQAIIEPSRRLKAHHAIRIDVTRVASFYLHKWAGIAPDPDDPPPR